MSSPFDDILTDETLKRLLSDPRVQKDFDEVKDMDLKQIREKVYGIDAEETAAPAFPPQAVAVPKKSESAEETYESVMAKLDGLIGLEEIKDSIKNLIKRLEGQKLLQEKSAISIGKPNLHMIYSGPPGTGKTEVARIVAKILHLLGYIPNNNVVETDRSGLVGEFAGSTAQKVMKKIQESIGGVLFIDEAYALANSDGYGKEAIDTLIKAIEDYRGQLVVILAGYEAEMDMLIQQNPGFKSRIPHRYRFKDYTPKELTAIAKKMLADKGYKTEAAIAPIETFIKNQCRNGALEGNARSVRNLIERVIQNHMIRVGEEKPQDLETIQPIDVEKAAGLSDSASKRDGMDEIRTEAIKKLDSLVGLADVKTEIKRILNFFALQKRKQQRGLSVPPVDLNMVFTGDAGTGKTEVARVIGEILKGNGILSNGQLKEVARGDLVGNVVGDTAQKVKKVFSESLGGILFIDQAYALASGDSYGQEAIDTLIKEIDDNKGNAVVILAGYPDQTAEMLAENPGFKSRFRYQFRFPNYTVEEVFEIVKIELSKFNLSLTPALCLLAHEHMKKMGAIEGNGRWALQFVEKLQIVQGDRLIRENSDDFYVLTEEDLLLTLNEMKKNV